MKTHKQIAFKKGYKYQLFSDTAIITNIKPKATVNTRFITLYKNGVLKIKADYAWDGATSAIDTNSFMRGSLAHDALYQLMRGGKLPRNNRNKADRLLQKICIEDGMFKIRAYWVYKAVNLFGAKNTLASKKRPLLFSPKGKK